MNKKNIDSYLDDIFDATCALQALKNLLNADGVSCDLNMNEVERVGLVVLLDLISSKISLSSAEIEAISQGTNKR